MPSSLPSPTSGGISAVHPDIIQTHILTKIDGPTLASAACASPLLHALCTEEKLWTDICNSTWPSTSQSFVSDIISTFPAGHRSFFSDTFSGIDHRQPAQPVNWSFTSPQLISAVDIHYGKKVIYSKVEITETETEWFRCSPFRIDLLDRKEPVTAQVKFENDDVKFQLDLQKNMSLSWVLIDPTRKRAVNLSSRLPVSVTRHWLTGDVQAEYAVVMTGDRLGRSSEFIKCSVVVTCGGKEGGDLHVREVGMHVQDMEGKGLSGRDSLVILEGALESGRRKKGNEERERYGEYLEMMRESRERKLRRERKLDLLCIVDRLGRSSEFIKCSVVVTCGGKEGGDLHVREVGMHVQDMEGKGLSGRDSLVILEGALESGRRKKGNEERERYGEYLEMMRESRERKLRRERKLDLLCIVTGVTIFMAFWGFILLR